MASRSDSAMRSWACTSLHCCLRSPSWPRRPVSSRSCLRKTSTHAHTNTQTAQKGKPHFHALAIASGQRRVRNALQRRTSNRNALHRGYRATSPHLLSQPRVAVMQGAAQHCLQLGIDLRGPRSATRGLTSDTIQLLQLDTPVPITQREATKKAKASEGNKCVSYQAKVEDINCASSTNSVHTDASNGPSRGGRELSKRVSDCVHLLRLHIGLQLGCVRSIKCHLSLLTLHTILDDVHTLQL
jgi:hypothetical protein